MFNFSNKLPNVLALLFIFIALGFHFVLSNRFLSLPTDFSYSSELSSVDNFYDESTQSFSGEQYSTSEFSYEVTGFNQAGYLIRNFFCVKSLSGEVIVAIEREYGIDPFTQAHVPSLGDHEREGYLFAPSHLEAGENFVYWHVNYDAPALMSFVEQTTLYGLPVFHYESYYPDVTVDQTKDLDALPGVPEERGVVLEPHLELWVEPLTGHLIKYKDDTTAYFYDITTLERIAPWNHFTNVVTEQSTQEHALDAKLMKIKMLLFETYFPIFFLGLAFFTFLYGLWHRNHLEKGNTGIHWLVPVFIVALPVIMLSSTWMVLRSSMLGEMELLFDQRVEALEDSILRRIEIYANTLEGATGLFAASETVTRSEWKVYVEALELNERYPGVLGVGFAVLVPAEEKVTHITNVRSEGYPDYSITPEGDRALYSSIVYLEPFEGDNVLAFGYDMLTEDVRKETMDLARDSGEVAVSGKVALVQDANHPGESGFLMYLPIYKNALPHETVSERRQNIEGYVYSPFRVSEFIQGGLYDSNLSLNFNIYDGLATDAGDLMFSYSESESAVPTFSRIDTLYLLGRPWTLELEGLDEFELNPQQKLLLYGSLGIGVLVSLLFIFLFLALLISRQRLINYIRKKKRFISL